MIKKNISEKEGCGKMDCGCVNSQDSAAQAQIRKENELKTDYNNQLKEEKNLDPTHFGDWQVGCRTIDF